MPLGVSGPSTLRRTPCGGRRPQYQVPGSSLLREKTVCVATEVEAAGMDDRVVVRAESRWPPALAVLVFVVLNGKLAPLAAG